MSLNFRNLVLLAFLCGIVTSLSISSDAHRSHNRHMINLHDIAKRFISHEQASGDATDFVSKITTSIDTIVQSINADTPAIIQTKNIQAFAFPKGTCEGLAQEQKDQVVQKVKDARQKVTQFKANLNAQNNKKVAVDAQNSLKYLGLIQLLMTTKCRNIKNLLIGPSPFQTNINTKKSWILGGITLNDLVKDYINRATVNNNVTNCGTQTPFWNGQRCIKCQEPNPVFNIATGQCTVCPEGTVYDFKTKSCIPGGPINYKPHKAAAEPKIVVPEGTPDDAIPNYLSTGKTQCPEDKPQVKDNACFQCPPEAPFYNIITKECQPCPDGAFNQTTHICKAKPQATDVPVQTPNLVMNDNSTDDDWNNYVNQNKNKVLCPVQTPYWNGTDCIKCPHLFNIISKTCQECPPGLHLNTATHKCQPADKLQPELIDLFNAVF